MTDTGQPMLVRLVAGCLLWMERDGMALYRSRSVSLELA